MPLRQGPYTPARAIHLFPVGALGYRLRARRLLSRVCSSKRAGSGETLDPSVSWRRSSEPLFPYRVETPLRYRAETRTAAASFSSQDYLSALLRRSLNYQRAETLRLAGLPCRR